jgi:hypothetical protein
MHKRIIGSTIIMVLTISQVLFSFPFNLPEVKEAHAATRLGLLHTQEELNCWRQRAGIDAQGSNGITCPVMYKTTGDVSTNSPGNWTRIQSKANEFLANYTTATYERFTGQTTASCFSGPQNIINRTIGERLRDAGFVYLVTGNTAYRDAVRAKLLDQAAQPGTNFADTARWCPTTNASPDPLLDINMWLSKLTVGYDYIRSSLSASDQSTLDTWFLNAATFLETNIHSRVLSTRFPNRKSNDYSTVGGGNLQVRGPLWFGGPNFLEFHAGWQNQEAAQVRAFGLIAIVLNNTTLKNEAKRWFKEYIRYGVFYTNTNNITTSEEYYR